MSSSPGAINKEMVQMAATGFRPCVRVSHNGREAIYLMYSQTEQDLREREFISNLREDRALGHCQNCGEDLTRGDWFWFRFYGLCNSCLKDGEMQSVEDFSSGSSWGRPGGLASDLLQQEKAIEEEPGRHMLRLLREKINAATLSLVTQKAQLARGTYETTEPVNSEDVIDAVTSFYAHLLEYTKKVPGPIDSCALQAEAFALLDKAFRSAGGIQFVFRAAMRPSSETGIRHVLDAMTQEYIKEEQEKYVNYQLKSLLESMDWDGMVTLLKEIKEELGPFFPPDITTEELANSLEVVGRVYVESVDRINSLFSSY